MDVSEEVSWFFNAIIGNAAVPFFFTASGFLFFNNWRSLNAADKKRKLKKYVLHIFRMYIIWSLIFLPWKILNINTVGWSLKAVAQYVWDFVFVTSGDALWYLPSLIFSIYILYILEKVTNKYVIIAVTSIIYIIGVLISSWYQLFESIPSVDIYYKIFQGVNNGLFKGLMFTAIGMLISQKGKISNNRLMIFVMFAVVTMEAALIRLLGYNRDNVANMFSMPLLTYFCLA